MVKTGKKAKGALANIWFSELYGKRELKYETLNQTNFSQISNQLSPSSPHYAWVKRDEAQLESYNLGFSVQGLFPLNSVGIVTARDDFTIQFSAEVVKETINQFLSLEDEEARTYFELGKDARDWQVAYARADLKKSGVNFNNITKISYRPFDERFTYFTGRSKGFHCMPRGAVMQHMLNNNVGLLLGRAGQVVGDMPWNLCTITNKISDFNLFYRGGGVLFPLYTYPDSHDLLAETTRTPNLNMPMVDALPQAWVCALPLKKPIRWVRFRPSIYWITFMRCCTAPATAKPTKNF